VFEKLPTNCFIVESSAPIQNDSYGIQSKPNPPETKEEPEEDQDDDDEEEEDFNEDEEEETPSELLLFFISTLSSYVFIQRQEQMKVVAMYVNIVHYSFVISHMIQQKMNYQIFYHPMDNVVLYPVV